MLEQWKTISNASNYEVSNLGNVRNKTAKLILSGHHHPNTKTRQRQHTQKKENRKPT